MKKTRKNNKTLYPRKSKKNDLEATTSNITILLKNESVLTHYLHNKELPKYKTKAQSIIQEYQQDIENTDGKHKISDQALQKLLFLDTKVPFTPSANSKFTFIDLFAGVGGFRLALQNLGGKCVFTSEWNKDAQQTYKYNFGELPFGDITKEETKIYIPSNFDVLCAGFPCQAFSIAGYQKGFSDTRGTLFFDIEQITQRHKPKVLFLENVKNLQSHDKGRTFKVMLDVLQNKLGYHVYHKVLNSMTHANVPQNRERIFIVAFDPNQIERYEEFNFPNEIPLTKNIQDVLEHDKKDDSIYYEKHMYYSKLKKAMKTKDTLYQWRRTYVRENKSNVCPTLTANMGSGGHNVPIVLDDYGIRKLTPRECFSFQGYPKNFVLPKIANSKLYMQAGNSVTVPLIERIGKEIVRLL